MPARPGSPVVLLFDTGTGGHHWEYLRHILERARTSPPRFRIHVVLHPALASHVPALWASASLRPPAVGLTSLTQAEARACRRRPLWAGALGQWRVALRHAAALSARHICFMQIDHLQLPLALRLPVRGEMTVSGILFRPPGDPPGAGGAARDAVRYARKTLLLRLALRNARLRTVLSLDPYFPAAARARSGRGDKVRPLPDPVPVPLEVLRRYGSHASPVTPPEGRRVFVLFGALARRKGVVQLLRALGMLDRPVAERVAIVLAGKLAHDVRAEALGLIADLRRRRPELWLQLLDRFVPEGELAGIVTHADVILLVYQRFVGSSGVLCWAAGAGKPVICQNTGLLGRLVRDYRLGVTVDTTEPGEIAQAFSRAVNDPEALRVDADRAAEFLKGRMPDRFADAVLETIEAAMDGSGGASPT